MKSARLERTPIIKSRLFASETVVLTPFCEEKQFGLLRALSLDEIEFDDVKDFQNLDAYPHAFETDMDILQWICAMAGESATGRALLQDAQDEGWTVRFDDLGQSGYVIDGETGAIVLDHYGFKAPALGKSAFFRGAVLINFIRVLREVWHDRLGTDADTDTGKYRPDALLLIERARAADRESIAILIAWEIREAGHSDIWRAILGSNEADMATVFMRAMEQDPSSFEDGSVLARTFCQWYKSGERIAACDHQTLETMDGMLENSPYEEPFGDSGVNGRTIEGISVLPCGEAYLKGMGKNICIDPYFVALNDPINEMHLFQIAYDSKVVRVEGVPFRDHKLANLIFPPVKVNV